MKVLIVNRYFYPDESATSRMATSLACGLARNGVQVRALASRSFHDDPTRELGGSDFHRGVAIHRIRTTSFGRHALLGRAIDYLTFHVAALLFVLTGLARGEFCVVCTDPPLLSATLTPAIWLRRGRLINWIMDLFPETAQELRVVGRAGPSARANLWLRDLSLRLGAANVAPIRRMAEYLAARGVAPNRLKVIHHWSDGEAIRPKPPGESVLRTQWGLKDKFIVGYSGNLGRAHDFTTIIAAARLLRYRRDIVFLFVGGGHRLAYVEREVERLSLPNIVMKPLQPREQLADSLSVADIHLVSLLPSLEHCIVPSKFYGIAAAGRPTLFIGAADGEIANLVTRGDCGAAVPIGAGQDLAGWITALAQSEALRLRMGANARRLLEAEFTEERGLQDWLGLLRSLETSSAEAIVPGGAATAAQAQK